MSRTTLLAWTVLSFSTNWAGLAQKPVSSIQFTAEEAAQAKKGAEELSKARNRNAKAELGWKTFRDTYQTGHPELPNLQFTSDFRTAFVKQPNSRSAVPDVVVSAVQLTSEQQHQASASYQEMVDSERDLQEKERQWRDLQYQLIADHVPSAPGGSVILLPGNKTYVFDEWAGGVAFTPDFRFGVPR